MFDKIKYSDPLGNHVYVNGESFGLEIVSVDLRNHVLKQMKKSIGNPTMIINVSENERLYCLGITDDHPHFFISHVTIREGEWYVSSTKLEYDKTVIYRMINLDKKLYSR